MKRLDEVFLGVRGKTVGLYMEFPPAISPTVADLVATLSNVLWALFDMPQEALVPLVPIIR